MAAIITFAVAGKLTDSLLLATTTPFLTWQDSYRREG